MAINSRSAARHLDLEPVLNWGKLARRDDLELVYRNGRTLTSGRVDMITRDGSVFWLIQNDGKGRAMFLPDDEVVVFRHRRPRKDGATGC